MKDYNTVIALAIIVSATIAVVFSSISNENFMTIMIGCVGFLGSKVLTKGNEKDE